MPTQLTTGDLVTAANWNTIPQGVLGYAQVTANEAGISSEVSLTGLSVTVDVLAGRRIKVTGSIQVQHGSADGRSILFIKTGATQLQRRDAPNQSLTVPAGLEAHVILAPSAGSKTYRLTLAAVTGTTSMLAATDQPAFILVEDMGPA